MAPRGAKRKHNPSIPAHIDQAALPKGVYWDPTGHGRWYVFEVDDEAPRFKGEPAKKRRRTIAGPNTKLSELHALVEDEAGSGTVEWMAEKYHASAKFKKLAATTQADYEYSRDVLVNLPTQSGSRVGLLQADRLRTYHLQKLVDRLEDAGTPTKAAKVLRYSRLLFGWCVRRGLMKLNPGKGLEAPKERRQQRLPTTDAYIALLRFARAGAAIKGREKGSVPAYLPVVMELGYLCRLRGIETLTLTEAQADDAVGIRTNRRKGSRDNIVEWNPRLRSAWDEALAVRAKILAMKRNRARPVPLRAEDRRLILAESGEPLTKSGLDTAWQRLVRQAIEQGVITDDQRFSLHDLKRKGGTDTPGTRAEKQDALGVTEQMMKTYDKSVPTTKPSA